MIISDKKQFIFIHIKKNAGSSVAKALAPHAANSAFIKFESVFRRLGCPIPFGPKRYNSHITAQQLVDEIGLEKFSDHYSFAIVRNPWDWQSSLYNYALKLPTHGLHSKVKEFGNFSAYLKWHCDNIEHDRVPPAMGVVTQSEFVYSRECEVLVDRIARFENLNEDFCEICKRIGVNAALPRINVHKSQHYHDDYSEETRKLVESYFQDDIRNFGYEY